MRMQARHDVGRFVDVGGVRVGWVVCKLLQSGALVCGCGQRLCGLAGKKASYAINIYSLKTKRVGLSV